MNSIKSSLPELVFEQEMNIEKLQGHVQELHKTVSDIETPKGAVKTRPDGLEYVELAYMKNIADLYYPGWSWEIISYQFIGDQAVTVHGRLIFFDGVKRIGDMIAGHRIQKKRDDKTKYVDIGNDVKSAVTDTLKKAFNTFMNIADDVYKKTGEYLSNEQINKLFEIAEQCGSRTKLILSNKLKNNEIDVSNYDEMLKALKNKLEEVKEKSQKK